MMQGGLGAEPADRRPGDQRAIMALEDAGVRTSARMLLGLPEK
jgi:hypothetical protein